MGLYVHVVIVGIEVAWVYKPPDANFEESGLCHACGIPWEVARQCRTARSSSKRPPAMPVESRRLPLTTTTLIFVGCDCKAAYRDFIIRFWGTYKNDDFGSGRLLRQNTTKEPVESVGPDMLPARLELYWGSVSPKSL